MDEPAIDECFRLLRLRRGVDFTAVKQAYRRNLYKCHPDRFQKRADLLPVAERKTKRLVQVYGVLERWYQENGGTDLVTSSGYSGQSTANSSEWSPDEEDVPTRSRRFGVGLAVAAAASVLAAVAWWLRSEPPAKGTPSPVGAGRTVATEPIRADEQPQAMAQQAVPDMMAVELKAMVAERARVKSAWVAAYMRDGEAEQHAAEKELADALIQYGRDVRDRASEIRDAQDETARQVERFKRDSAVARERFDRQEQASLETLKTDYDAWLLARGVEAVAKIKELRKREDSTIGVFSDTEDPHKIFEFWTADEAGGPEVNIAAKTGVTVRQPDDRFFPHFRSNIFLYSPEGKTLVQMMESIVERHGSLMKELADRGLAREAELANWDSRHPAGPVQLSGAQESVVEGRDRAIDRLSKARVRLEDATLAMSSSNANAAFENAPKGKEWADRISAMQKTAALAQSTH
jgi:hypothetical protein